MEYKYKKRSWKTERCNKDMEAVLMGGVIWHSNKCRRHSGAAQTLNTRADSPKIISIELYIYI